MEFDVYDLFFICQNWIALWKQFSETKIDTRKLKKLVKTQEAFRIATLFQQLSHFQAGGFTGQMDHGIETGEEERSLNLLTIVDHVEYVNDFLKEQKVNHYKFHNRVQLRDKFIEKIIAMKNKEPKKGIATATADDNSDDNSNKNTVAQINAAAEEKITISIFFNVLDEIVSEHHFMHRSKATRAKHSINQRDKHGSIIRRANNNNKVVIVQLGTGITGIDTTGDGKVDSIDTNMDGKINAKLIDTNGDGILDTTVIFDAED